MNNEDLIFPILQKYYSALEQIDNLNITSDIFENISKVDTFFSEFRNITFVMQKVFSTEELKQYYDEKRTEYLINNDMKWFVDKRNSSTKEEPFRLEKDIKLDLYLPFSKEINFESKITVDNDINFDTLFDELRKVLMSFSDLLEVFFSVELTFRENGSEIDIYEKIKEGIVVMNKFITTIINDYPCASPKCNNLKKRITKSYRKVLLKNISFVWEGTIEGGELVFGENIEPFFDAGQNGLIQINNIKVPVKGSMFDVEDRCELSLFKNFTLIHLHIYKDQGNDMMPVFMIVYEDDTFSLMPFVATNKAKFYRMISKVKRIIKNSPVRSVFFMGDYYTYDFDNLNLIQRPYKERIKMAQKIVLSSVMISKVFTENLGIFFDVDNINEDAYISKQLNNVSNNTIILSLQPIFKELNSK